MKNNLIHGHSKWTPSLICVIPSFANTTKR